MGTLCLAAFENFCDNAQLGNFVCAMVVSARVSGIENELLWLLRVERKIDHLAMLNFEAFSQCACDKNVYLSAITALINIPSLNMIKSLAGLQRAMQ